MKKQKADHVHVHVDEHEHVNDHVRDHEHVNDHVHEYIQQMCPPAAQQANLRPFFVNVVVIRIRGRYRVR